MLNRGSKLLVAGLVGVMLLAGCSGLKGKNANTKPPLVVPASFATEGEKRDFLTRAIGDGYYKEATPLLKEMTADDSNSHDFVLYGTALYNTGDYAGAVEAWSKAMELTPVLSAEMKNNIGNALRDSGKYDEAEAAYADAIALDPNHWRAAVNLATLLKTQGRTDEAIQVLETARTANANVAPLVSLLDAYRAQPQG